MYEQLLNVKVTNIPPKLSFCVIQSKVESTRGCENDEISFLGALRL